MTPDLKSTIADLRAKAEAATPGPWEPLPGSKHAAVIRRNHDGALGAGVHAKLIISADIVNDDAVVGVDEEDRAYIAAASPTTITEVCKALEDAWELAEERRKTSIDLFDECRRRGTTIEQQAAELATLRARLAELEKNS